MIIKVLPENRSKIINSGSVIPTGPTVSTNFGEKAQNRTYQDLLKNKTDEFNFLQLATSELYKISINGKFEKWLDSNMYTNISDSPDGNYVMITKINKPFSYLVTYRRFPTSVDIYSSDARLISNLIDLPLIEELPKGFMSVRTGKRNFSWRADKPSTLTYVEALDGGDPSKDVKYRDEVFELNAPFADEGKTILKTINRFRGIDWGNNNFAIAYDYWWNTRNEKTYVFNPSNIDEKVKVIVDRNYQDNYSDPGYFISERNIYNTSIVSSKTNRFIY